MQKPDHLLEDDVRDTFEFDPALDNHQGVQARVIIDEAKIRITNEGHTIYLTGTVGSAVAMRQAVETASHAPGVREVINDLVIEP